MEINWEAGEREVVVYPPPRAPPVSNCSDLDLERMEPGNEFMTTDKILIFT